MGMKWQVTFLDGRPDEEVEADSWKPHDYGWVYFIRKDNPEEKLVAAFHSNILRSIRLME